VVPARTRYARLERADHARVNVCATLSFSVLTSQWQAQRAVSRSVNVHIVQAYERLGYEVDTFMMVRALLFWCPNVYLPFTKVC
jgi:hypothetical protein